MPEVDEHGLTDYGHLMKLMGEPIKDDIEIEEIE